MTHGYGRQPSALAGYAAIAGTYAAAVGGYAALFRRSGRRLPGSVPAGDVVLLGAATFKLSRLVARDKVTSFLRAPFTRYEEDAPGPEVNEAPRGHGIPREVGELLTCPFCVGQWVGTALMGLYLVSPPLGRVLASLLTAVAVSDGLQFAESALHSTQG